ncbi:MAG: SpaA isopeptide-forming pilin-related protein [Gudongella sp.]|nr:SpaA isopeptide-forming pilin-related protein [Gudongella sp.]
MKNNNKVRIISFLVALLMIFQIIPLNISRADGPVDLLAEDLVKIVGTDGEPVPYWDDVSPDLISSIVIKVGDTELELKYSSERDEYYYENVPVGATIDVQVGFWLDRQEEVSFYADDYFAIALPTGIDYGPELSGSISDKGNDFANWEITSGSAIVKMTEGIEGLIDEIWGTFGFSGEFEAIGSGGGEDDYTEIEFGGKTIKIYRAEEVEEPDMSTLSKSAVYNPETNEIEWTINISPIGGKPSDYSGYKLIDTLSGNHNYVTGSFSLKNGDEAFSYSGDTELTITGGKKIEYTFPENSNINGPITVTYKTIPTDANIYNKSYSNKAQLFLREVEASNEASDTVSLSGLLSKNGAVEGTIDYTSGSAIVKWTVTLTLPKTDKAYTFNDAKIIDSLTGKHVFDTSKDVMLNSTVVDVGTAKGEYAIDGNTLTYTFPDGEPKTSTSNPITYVLTYYTTISDWDGALDSNSSINLGNNAKFTWGWDRGGEDKGTSEYGIPGVGVNISSSGGLINKSAVDSSKLSFNNGNDGHHYIQWKIVVNRNKVDMGSNVVIKDNLPAGLDLVADIEHPIVIAEVSSFDWEGTGNGLSYLNGNRGFELNLNTATGQASITDTYTITFWSKLNQTGIKEFYKNTNNKKDVSFINNVDLFRDETESASASATKTYTSQMLNKAHDSYDYSTRLTKWTITVNRNKLPMTNAVVSDKLPSGLVLFIDEEHPFSVSPNLDVVIDAENGEDEFTVTLPSPTSETYTITYWTYTTDAGLLSQNSKLKFVNNVTLKQNDYGDITDTSTLEINNKVITKGVVGAQVDDVVNWKVEINHAEVELVGAYVEDTLSDALSLVSESVKLFYAKVAADGTLTKDGEVTKGDGEDEFNFTINGQEFMLQLPDGPNAYILEFETVVTKTATLENTISLKGNSGKVTGSDTKTGVSVKEQYSSGGSGEYVLRVKKVDNNENPIAGVQFKLLTTKGEYYRAGSIGVAVTSTTDANGIAEFTGLPNWTFYVEEVEPPAGFLKAEVQGGVKPTKGESDIHITVINELALADIEITKVGHDGVTLSGGSFGLYKDNEEPYKTAIALDGKVTFEDVPLGSYTIKEITPPAGHNKTNEEITVTVGYNNDKTDTVVTYSYSKLVNEPNGTDIEFTKTDMEGNNISGGLFELRRDNEPFGEPVAANNGKVVFEGIGIGSYTIVEIEVPDGYLMPINSKIFDVEVEYNEEKAGLVYTLTPNGDNEGLYGENDSFKNALAEIDVVIYKLSDSANPENREPLSGGMFGLYDVEGNEVDRTTANTDGSIVFNDVPVGDYTIKEISAPSGYKLTTDVVDVFVYRTNKDTEVSVSYESMDSYYPDGEIEFPALVNERKPYEPGTADIIVEKVDEDGKALSGAVFTLYNSSGKALETAVSGKNGKATFTNIDPNRDYTIKETKAPEGFELSDEVIEMRTRDGGTHNFTMVNKAIEPEEPETPEEPTEPVEPGTPEEPKGPDTTEGNDDSLPGGAPDIPGTLPKTGFTSNEIAMILGIIGLTLGALIGMSTLKRKNRI